MLAAVFTVAAGADTHADVVDLFAQMAAALSGDNAAEFMKAFDRKMPSHGQLETQITGLLANAELASSVELLKDEGDEQKRDVEVDWYLELRSRVRGGPLVQRRAVIQCQVEKQGKRWRIVSIKPIEFFDAPKS
jgi:hypothetical protein